MKLRRALVWHPTLTIRASGTSTMGGSTKNKATSTHTHGSPTKPGMKTCRGFNESMCLKPFCLKTTNRAYPHTETSCNRKEIPVPTKNT